MTNVCLLLFIVLTAADTTHMGQQHYNTVSEKHYSYFMKALCEAGGWDMINKIDLKKLSTENSKKATLEDTYKYIEEKMKKDLKKETSNPQRYGDLSFIFFKR